ncbi:MAG TPA: AAA family ATPase [Actinomycetota bacterium]
MEPPLQPYSPLGLQMRRVTGALVGRPSVLAAVRQELEASLPGRLAAVTVEGEPGIGKTRLLLAVNEMAEAAGYTSITVAADEELRGPFLLARSILGAPEAVAVATGTPAEEDLRRSLEILSGRDDAGLASLPPDQKLLRACDLAAIAVGSLAAQRPLAISVDDLQWADEDSLRLLRYLVRADATCPILLVLALRPDEFAFVTEAVTLIADMERLGLVRRLKLKRFTLVETAEMLRQVLGGAIDGPSAATVHAQAEGVPFILEELARAYRDAGMIQEIDGRWTLAKNAERLVPSAVRTLISRRAARLPDATKSALALAAVLGRRFSLKDVREVMVRVTDEEAPQPEVLAETLRPAVAAGLLLQHGADSPADYSFAHEQVREFAAGTLTPARRRGVHQAIVQLLLAGEPTAESLPVLAHHARAAGDAAVCVRFSIEATRNALAANAPEEVLRVVELALPTASAAQDRVALLQARDQGLDMLRRPQDRLQGLAELAALVEALGDSHLELDVQLRRAAALRLSEQDDQAAAMSMRVRELALQQEDREAELAACLELGQDLLHAPLGETFTPPEREVDFDAAEEAYARAAELAEALQDRAALASSLRELGVIDLGRVRAWFVEQVQAGRMFEMLDRITSGETLHEISVGTPLEVLIPRTAEKLERALSLFEEVGDRRGAMSTIIAMAYLHWAPDIHLGSGAARHIEEIRRLASRMQSMAKESERALAEAQMVYGVHVFARAKGIPDLAVSRGEEAYRLAQAIGDRALEFLAAGGTALAHLDLGEVAGARTWVDRASTAAVQSPTPLRARLLEVWRGITDAGAGDPEGMRRHLERALELATEQGSPAARCEILARLALEAAKLGAERGEDGLLALAESSAAKAKELIHLLPGHPPWGAQADAALARVWLARGANEQAVEAAGSAFGALESAMHEDLNLDIMAPAAEAMLAAGGEDARRVVGSQLRIVLALIAQRTLDGEVRARWFRGPVGGRLSRMLGDAPPPPGGEAPSPTIDEGKMELLRLVMEGHTNAEIATALGVQEPDVTRRLGELFAAIGASSRAEATAFAFREQVL